jgi:3-phosphoglycerate kinase
MKKTIRDFDLENRKVIIRVDFNVPIKNGEITDDNRIKESLETINYALKNKAKVILLSHLGRVKTEEDKLKNSLDVVSKRLSQLLAKEVKFSINTRGEELESLINELKTGDVLLIENTRYEDLDGKKESSNDEKLGAYWASLGEIFINDAFGTAHRAHASNVGIASNIPSGVGFLIEKELENLEKVIENPEKPFTLILGGAKVADKIGVIKNLAPKVDNILIGGGMAYTFLKAAGINIGKSMLSEEDLDFCKEMMEKYEDKIILPIDTVNGKEVVETEEGITRFISDTKEDEIGMDIGYATVKLFSNFIKESKVVVWNGTMGISEFENFKNGTIGVCEALKETEATKIIGGGDTAAAVIKLGYKEYMTHISTGGGASLELLEGKKLPGIEIIEEK